MRIACEITSEDIRQGVQDNCDRCPGARAINRALRALGIQRAALTASVMSSWFVLCDSQDALYFEAATPPRLRDFIIAFDRLKASAKPTKFALQIPKAKIEEWRGKPLAPARRPTK